MEFSILIIFYGLLNVCMSLVILSVFLPLVIAQSENNAGEKRFVENILKPQKLNTIAKKSKYKTDLWSKAHR